MKYSKKSVTTGSASLISPAVSGVIVGTPPAALAFLPWQPSTWPPAPKQVDGHFIAALEKIFRESILDEIGNVIEDAKKSNGDLQHRGHVVALALMCALEAISAYGYRDRSKTYMTDFIANHFPREYKPHAHRFYRLYRSSLVHNWNLFEATLLPGNENITDPGGTLSFGLLNFFDALQTGVKDLVHQMKTDPNLQTSILKEYTTLRKTAKS